MMLIHLYTMPLGARATLMCADRFMCAQCVLAFRTHTHTHTRSKGPNIIEIEKFRLSTYADSYVVASGLRCSVLKNSTFASGGTLSTGSGTPHLRLGREGVTVTVARLTQRRRRRPLPSDSKLLSACDSCKGNQPPPDR